MKIFISDLHLGDGSRTDDFNRDRELIEFLDYVESKASELIIVGDLFELWQSDLERVLFAHDKVIKRLLSLREKIKLTYVIGNHDYIPFIRFIDSALGIELEYRNTENSIVAEHGNKYDIFNSYKNPLRSIKWPLGKRMALFAAAAERFLHKDADVWLSNRVEDIDSFLHQAISMQNKVTPSSKQYIDQGGHFGEFSDAAIKHIEKGSKIVIFGHTHRPQLDIINNGIYANCGTWTDDAMPTYIAYNKNNIQLREGLTHKVIKTLEVGKSCC